MAQAALHAPQRPCYTTNTLFSQSLINPLRFQSFQINKVSFCSSCFTVGERNHGQNHRTRTPPPPETTTIEPYPNPNPENEHHCSRFRGWFCPGGVCLNTWWTNWNKISGVICISTEYVYCHVWMKQSHELIHRRINRNACAN